MGKVYWNRKEIPIPQGGFINHHDGRVYIYLDPGATTRESRKLKIGQATSETTMHPNDNFRQRYPDLWQEYYGPSGNDAYELRCGLYAVTLSIAHSSGLYQMLTDCYGPLYANAILDYAMYSIAEECDVTMDLEGKMRSRAVFSKDRHGDSWYSKMFEEMSSPDDGGSDRSGLLRSKWMDKVKKDGCTSAWIGIDGSNSDCDCTDCDLAEHGHDKSGKHGSIVGYMYAVNSDTGLPITYTSYNGGKVDSKAFVEMIGLLSSHGIGIDGVIMDRGFCTTGVVDTLEKLGYPYVIMLTSDTEAYGSMMGRYGTQMRWNMEHLISEKGLIGVTDKARIFTSSKHETTVGFYFDCANGSERALHLMGKVFREAERLREVAEENSQKKDEGKKKSVEVASGLGKYIGLKNGEDGKTEVILNTAVLQKAVDSKGYSAIASSEELDAMAIDRIYHSRDVSEKQYMIMKSQLGFSVYRVHDKARIESKQLTVFVASIIRSRIAQACSELKKNTARMLLELDRIRLVYNYNTHTYSAIQDLSQRAKDLFSFFQLKPSDIDIIASEINRRSSDPVQSQMRPMPSVKSERNTGGRPRNDKPEPDPNTPKRGRGRPAGSKNKVQKPKVKKTVQKEKGKPGRPKGAKDSKPRKKRSKPGDSSPSEA